MNQSVEVFGRVDLDAVVELQSGSGCARPDVAFGPACAFDEQHALRSAPELTIAVHPEESTHGVSDRDEDAGVVIRVLDEQPPDDGQDAGEWMAEAMFAQFRVVEREWRQEIVGVEVVFGRSFPGFADQTADDSVRSGFEFR